MPAVPCVFKALVCQSGWHLLTATVLIKQTPYFVTLCFIYLSPRKELDPFIWTHPFLLFGAYLCTADSHLFWDIKDAWQDQSLCYNMFWKTVGRPEASLQLKVYNCFTGKKLIIIMWIMLTLVPVTAVIFCPSQSQSWRELRQTQRKL